MLLQLFFTDCDVLTLRGLSLSLARSHDEGRFNSVWVVVLWFVSVSEAVTSE